MTMPEIDPSQVVVVTPGGADDPFTKNTPVVPSNQVVASPAEPAQPGFRLVGAEEGTKLVPSQAVVSPTPSSPATAPVVSATPGHEPSPLELAVSEGRLEEYIAEQARDAAQRVARAQQSSYDKQAAELRNQLKDAQVALKQREREGKLANEDLSEQEKDLLRGKWELEDERVALDEYNAETDIFFRRVFIANLVQENPQFGVTAEDLEAFEEPEEMEAFVKDAEINFWRTGGKATVIPSSAPVASAPQEKPAPAGASAPSDIGGQPAYTPAATASKGMGVDAVKQTIESLPWVAVNI